MDLDSPVTAPIDMGHRTFLAQTHAIIDPTQVAAAAFADLPIQVLDPPALKGRLRQPPLLLPLNALSWEQRLALLDRADTHLRDRGRPLFGTLLACDDAPRLRQHLQHLMGLWQPGKGRVLLRVHDPRVFRHLRWLLSPDQMAHVMGPVQAWTWHEPLGGTWRTHLRPEDKAPFGLMLAPGQWQQLSQVGVLNGCLRELAHAGFGAGSRHVHDLLEGMLEARSAGIDSREDLSLYARQRLVHGQRFRNRPEVAARLNLLQAERMSYAMACRWVPASRHDEAAA